MLNENEIREVAQKIVSDSKDTAHVDQGSLKKSIAYTYKNGEVTFRELYYGQWKDNSQLERNAKRDMPYGVSWKIIYTELGGDEYEKIVTRTGRKSQRLIKKSISNRIKTDNVNRLISLIQKRRKNGKKKE